MDSGKHARCVVARDVAVILGFHGAAVVGLYAAALDDPRIANAREALCDVYRDVRIGVGAGWVIDAK